MALLPSSGRTAREESQSSAFEEGIITLGSSKTQLGLGVVRFCREALICIKVRPSAKYSVVRYQTLPVWFKHFEIDSHKEDHVMNMRTVLPTLWDRDEKAPAGISSFRREMDRLFDDFSRGFHIPNALTEVGKFDLAPEMDVSDSEKEITLSIELPGVNEKDIDVSASGQVISITGEKKSESETKNGDLYRSERSYGSFCRSLSMPFNIDGDKVQAKLNNGVLTVTIPKPAEMVEKTKKIAVKS
jgi:HSP20 family protein